VSGFGFGMRGKSCRLAGSSVESLGANSWEDRGFGGGLLVRGESESGRGLRVLMENFAHFESAACPLCDQERFPSGVLVPVAFDEDCIPS
jgi:hypothetical protein